MKCSTKKLRPPTKRPGGKGYLARRIIDLFPCHRIYCEPYLGGGSILLNKPESFYEIVGDLDSDLIHFWRVLQERPRTLVEFANEVSYDEATFRKFLAMSVDSDAASPAVWALRTLVVNRFSRGGMGKDFSWSDRLRGGQPEGVNAWDTIRAELPAIAGRINLVEFHCCEAIQLIRSTDCEDCLTYCDPPYLHETRTAKKIYDHEMTREQHAELLGVLLGCRGKVVLSGYRNDLYDLVLRDWRRVDFEIANHGGQGKTKQRRVESVWMNYPE